MSLAASETPPSLPRLSISYDPTDPDASALRIILTLRPEWKQWEQHISFTRFTDGITNTLLKAENKRPGLSKDDIDREAILLRAYGNGTDVLIDRNRETTSHFVCAKQGLAPPLFARIDNGLLYKFIPGSACSAPDLRRPEVWRGVARRLGHWHASLPVSSISSVPSRKNCDDSTSSNKSSVERLLAPDIPRPNVWTVTESWISALPQIVPCTPERQAMLQRELEYIVSSLSKTSGISNTPYVFAHNDLLSGNVIIESSTDRQRRSSEQDAIVPPSQGAGSTTSSRSGTPASSLHGDDALPISFIDYEYANAAPAAFDIANHFSEWGGLECEYKALPTKSQRREFLVQYVSSFCRYRARDSPVEGMASSHEQSLSERDQEAQLEQLFQEVNQFRGVPGFYWGIWALIQSGISAIDFDYANYAELRLDSHLIPPNHDFTKIQATAREGMSFDMDGLLLNTEDLYTICTNELLHKYGKPDLPWNIKAKLQGRPGPQAGAIFRAWAQLPISEAEFVSQQSVLQKQYFPSAGPLPGVPSLLSVLRSSNTKTATDPPRPIHLALATSSHRGNFGLKTAHLEDLFSAFPASRRVLGDDERVPKGRGKPLPDIYLVALGIINAELAEARRAGQSDEPDIQPEECLVFEDSVPGVEAGRRAGMQVVWCPHEGLLKEYEGREDLVLAGGMGEHEDVGGELDGKPGTVGDGWAVQLKSLEDFDYGRFGIVPGE